MKPQYLPIIAFFYILFITNLSSCGSEDVNPESDAKEPKAINEGKGFSTIAVLIPEYLEHIHGSDYGVSDSYSFADMTLSEDGGTIHLSTWESLKLPTYNLLKFDRVNIHLSDGSIDTLSPPSEWEPDIRNYFQHEIGSKQSGFVPRSEKMYEGWVTYDNFGRSYVSIVGDISYSRSLGGNFGKTGRVTKAGEIVEKLYGDTNAKKAGGYGNRIFPAYQNSNGILHEFNIENLIAVSSQGIYTGEIVPIGANTENLLMFGVSAAYLYLTEFPVSLADSTISSIEFMDSLAIPDSWGNVHIGTKHIDDPNKIGIVLRNTEAPFEFITASYDISSKALTINNENVTIPNFETGKINYTIDELGNMWFDNYADNFQAESAISIYKVSNGNFTEIGKDLLVGGTITHFDYFDGKLFAIVNYSFEDDTFKYHRLAIIKED